MLKEKILEQIKKADEEFYVSGSAKEKDLIRIEKELGISLPPEYCWYILEYGSGGIGGAEILGVAHNGSLKCVEATKRFRKLGLIINTIVFYDAGEFVYCLDLDNLNGKTASVNRWDPSSKQLIKKYDSFLDCVYDLFDEELMNL